MYLVFLGLMVFGYWDIIVIIDSGVCVIDLDWLKLWFLEECFS